MSETSGPGAWREATRDLPPVQTARLQNPNDWYQALLGVDPHLANECFSFRRLHTEHFLVRL